MSDCLFCKFISGEIKTEAVYEDEQVFAFKDIHPQAPTHILVIPKKHIHSLNHLSENDGNLIGSLYLAAKIIAQQNNIHESGYRCLINCGSDGGQSVFHIHLHLLGGRPLGWPPG